VAAAKQELQKARGNDKSAKKKRRQIKRQIESLQQSLSSFAQSSGFMTHQQQLDLYIKIQSNSLVGFGNNTKGGTARRSGRKGKGKGKVGRNRLMSDMQSEQPYSSPRVTVNN